jgi:hypothetical protein
MRHPAPGPPKSEAMGANGGGTTMGRSLVWGDVPRTSIEAESDVEGAQSEREQAGRAMAHGNRRSSRTFCFVSLVLSFLHAQPRGLEIQSVFGDAGSQPKSMFGACS